MAGSGKPAKKAATRKAAGKKAPARKSGGAKSGAAKAGAAKKAAGGGVSTVAPENLAVRADKKAWRPEELDGEGGLLGLGASRIGEEISDSESDMAEMRRERSDAGGEDEADTGPKTFERADDVSLA